MMITDSKGKQYSMDGYMYSNLMTAKTQIRKDWDMVFVFDGGEGTGKSVITQQCADFCCEIGLTLDFICMTAMEFKRQIKAAKQYQAVIYDEAYSGLNSRATMSYINKALVSMMSEIRQKNLFVFIVLPSFFDLDKNIALWRSRALIHVYKDDDWNRGYFAFFDSERKKDLYIGGKKTYNYRAAKPNFIGRFTNHYTVDEAAYRKKKYDSLHRNEGMSDDKELKRQFMDWLFKRIMAVGEGMTNEVKAKLLGVSAMTYYRWVNQYKAEHDGLPPEPVEENQDLV